MIVLVMPLSVGASASAAGNSRLAEYFVSDPVGGTPIPNRQLEALVALEERATSSFDPGVVAAAQGWTNTKTQARFIEVAGRRHATSHVRMPMRARRSPQRAVCAGGSVSAFHALVSVANAYEAACSTGDRSERETVRGRRLRQEEPLPALLRFRHAGISERRSQYGRGEPIWPDPSRGDPENDTRLAGTRTLFRKPLPCAPDRSGSRRA